jgi:hypothetical protein
MDETVDMVLDTVRTLTRDNDGVVIEPVESEDGVLRIRYYEGTNEECPECVMPPDSFKEMVERMCRFQAPHITSVELEPAG